MLSHTHLLPLLIYRFSSVELLSRIQLFATPWTVARQTSLSIIDLWGYPQNDVGPESPSSWRVFTSTTPSPLTHRQCPLSGLGVLGELFHSIRVTCSAASRYAQPCPGCPAQWRMQNSQDIRRVTLCRSLGTTLPGMSFTGSSIFDPSCLPLLHLTQYYAHRRVQKALGWWTESRLPIST